MALHVEIDSDKTLRPAFVQISRDGERFEKHLGHDHGAPEIEHDPTIVNAGEAGGQTAEVAVARIANRGAVCRRMLMNDLGSQRGVNGSGNAEPARGEQDG
jgi:hypothetical protein